MLVILSLWVMNSGVLVQVFYRAFSKAIPGYFV